MTGEGQSYHERQNEQVQCTECGKDLARVSLDIHRQAQNGSEKGEEGKKGNE